GAGGGGRSGTGRRRALFGPRVRPVRGLRAGGCPREGPPPQAGDGQAFPGAGGFRPEGRAVLFRRLPLAVGRVPDRGGAERRGGRRPPTRGRPPSARGRRGRPATPPSV